MISLVHRPWRCAEWTTQSSDWTIMEIGDKITIEFEVIDADQRLVIMPTNGLWWYGDEYREDDIAVPPELWHLFGHNPTLWWVMCDMPDAPPGHQTPRYHVYGDESRVHEFIDKCEKGVMAGWYSNWRWERKSE